MPSSGTHTFTDPESYKASIGEPRIDLVVAGRGQFKAVLTRAELRQMRLLRCREHLASITYISLPTDLVLVAFPTRSEPPPIWGGLTMRSGDIVFHSRGDQMHQRTSGRSQKGFIAVTPEHLAIWSLALTEEVLVPPPSAQIIRPPEPIVAHLLYLHAQAGRLVERSPETIAHAEVARALEQDLIHTLINCLTPSYKRPPRAFRPRRMAVMARFEEVLAAHQDRPLHVPELCMAIGVPERTLRICCEEFLGISPCRYLRLRQLNLVRTALRNADPATASVAGIARCYGFGQLGRLAGMYRTVFGETPSTTLRLRRP